MSRVRPVAPVESGFTLVEMLVAMTIFAILAAAGVAILRASVDTQAAVDRRLGEIGEIARLQASLANDLGQAVDRQTRDGQTSRPAFVGEPGRMAFVRSGWTNLDDAPRSSLQRVEWRIAEGGLARIGHRRIDGANDGAAAVFARDSTAAFRFREANGTWSATYLSTDEHPLPAAVEVVVKPRAASAVTVVVALPAIVNRPPKPPEVPTPPVPPAPGSPA